MKIGVLAMQGAYREHISVLKKLAVEAIEVRNKEDILKIDAMIIPGGESTTIGKLIKTLDIHEDLLNRINSGMPIWGTCAGMIILANDIYNQKVKYLSTMNIEVLRNAYGRQLGSFNIISSMKNVGDDIPMVFIRAPYIKSVGNSVEVLATVNEDIVAAREKNMLVTSFHPELTNDCRVHKYFIYIVDRYLKNL